MCILCRTVLFIGFINIASCNYYCTMKSFEVNCSRMHSQELSSQISVVLNKQDITHLDIRDSDIRTVSEDILRDFNNLQSLDITNSGVEVLENHAFSNCSFLRKVNLKYNKLESFNFEAFEVDNKISLLDLSNNLLKTFENFNVSYFSSLKILNLTNNTLTSLPESLIEKLITTEEFYMLIDDNPWDCNISSWSDSLSSVMLEAFCGVEDTTYMTETKIDEVVASTTEAFKVVYEGETSGKTLKPMAIVDGKFFGNRKLNNACPDCDMIGYAILWCLIGIVVGIIVGNVPWMIRMACKKSKTSKDKDAQCDLSVVGQQLHSGVYSEFIREQVTSVATNTTDDEQDAHEETRL